MPYNKEEPNHVCMNPKCRKNDDGTGPAHYYACDSCVQGKPGFWKEYCCSIECFQQWVADMEQTGINPEYTKYIADEAKKHNITIAAAKPVVVGQTVKTTADFMSAYKKKHR